MSTKFSPKNHGRTAIFSASFQSRMLFSIVENAVFSEITVKKDIERKGKMPYRNQKKRRNFTSSPPMNFQCGFSTSVVETPTAEASHTFNNKNSRSETLGKVSAAWLLSKRGLVKESTYASYISALDRHILPKLGFLTPEEVTPALLETFFQEKLCSGRLDGEGGLSLKTVADLRGVLKLLLRYAQTHGHPNTELQLPALPRRSQKTQILTLEDQRRLEKELFDSSQPVALGALMALYGGLRIGEVCALRWDDIHFKNRTASISKTLIRIRDVSPGAVSRTKLVEDTPKTQCSCRIIPLPDFLVLHLWKYRCRGDAYILTSASNPMEPRVCLEHYKRLLASAQVGRYTFHALRHTFATRCVEQGVDIKSLSEIMGHASVTITMQRYVHPTMEQKRTQINKLTPLA